MSLESVAEDIREQARAEAEAIRAEAVGEAQSLLEDAEADAEELLAEREADIERQIEQERERGLSSAKLEAKQLRLGARRDALESVREAVEGRIEAIDGDERRELTEASLAAAVDEFDEGEELVVRGRSADAELLDDLVADDARLRAGDPVECLGGVVVEGTTTSVRVDNTFDAVLKEVWEDNLRSISDSLFEG